MEFLKDYYNSSSDNISDRDENACDNKRNKEKKQSKSKNRGKIAIENNIKKHPVLNENCNCGTKCFLNITDEERKFVNKNFWS
jgi:hypothetical protein